jgi:putative transcriptional regulator
MVYNRFKILLAQKETKENRRISYDEIRQATGIAASSLSAWATNSIDRYDRATIDKLCTYFGCTVGELIVHEPKPE